MTYDSRCLDLAEYFLQDEPTLKGKTEELAATIQDIIEMWIEGQKNPYVDTVDDEETDLYNAGFES